MANNPPLVKITARRDMDPTRSKPILRRYFSEINRRFNDLKRKVEVHIMDPSTLKGKEETESPGQLIIMAEKKRYVYEKSLDRMKEFMSWLDQQVIDGILTVESRPWLVSPAGESFWADTYIQSSYQKGIETARADMASAGATLPELGSVSVAMNKPFHADRLGLIFSRTFNGMKGLTDVMKAQMGRELAKGMGEGRSPYDIAYKLKDRVDKIGITRARLIARTEAIFAHNSAAMNEFSSLEGIIGEEIKVQWWTALDERVRDQHKAWHGRIYKKEKALTMLGAPNCLLGTAMCYSPSSIECTFERLYNGPIIVLQSTSGNQLTCTPNHPILTEKGFVPAGLLKVGENIISGSISNDSISISTNKKHVKSFMQDIVRSFSLPFNISSRTGTIPLNFHGDGAGSKVAVIRTNSKLMNDRNVSLLQQISKKKLFFRSMKDHFSSCYGALFFCFLRINLSSSFFLRCLRLIHSLFCGHLRPFQKFSFASRSDGDSIFSKSSIDSTSIAIEHLRKHIDGFAGEVQLDKLVSVNITSFSGHVFNLQNEKGYYLATDYSDSKEKVNYYITGNCRCTLLPWTKTLWDEFMRMDTKREYQRQKKLNS